ncbi:MAG: hypothetical protein ACREQN_16005 [Candidatus Binataceae bacterium]
MMTRKEWLYAMLALIGGLAGGALGNRYWGPLSAVAAPTAAKSARASHAPKSMTAQEFALVDNSGKTRALLHLNAAGAPVLDLFDTNGKLRAGLGIANDGVGLRLTDPQGATRVLLAVSGDGVAALRLYDAQGRPRALLGVDNEGEPALDFYADNGKLLRELP